MLRFIRPWIAIAAAPVLMNPAEALEKRAVPYDSDGSHDWNAGSTCHVNYYNTCTGWVWCWSGFNDGDEMGVWVNGGGVCTSNLMLVQTTHFICTSAPSGYGFTGTIAVHNVDANKCPTGAPIASQPYLPAYATFPFQTVSWGYIFVPNQFAVVVRISESMDLPNPVAFGTDHPAAGPTGPAACGTCYPANRPMHSFGYGNVAAPLCPGSPFYDGVCNAELLWDSDLVTYLSVDASTWGSIKALYR